MKKIIRIFMFLLVIVLFLINYQNVQAENPSCTYKYTKQDGTESSFVVTINIDGLANSKVTIESYDVTFGNNNTNSDYSRGFLTAPNAETGKDIIYDTAVEYYKYYGCPKYVYIYYLMDSYTGFFSNSEKKSMIGSPIITGVVSSPSVEENQERESYRLSSESVDDAVIDVEINYTKKTVTFSIETSDPKLEEYKNELLERKRTVSADDFKVCFNELEYATSVPKVHKYYLSLIGSEYYDSMENFKCYELNSKSENTPGVNSCTYFDNIKNNIDLKTFCNRIMKSRSYDDLCLQKCMNFEFEIEKKIDLNECGLSNKIVIWILNIIKWVKYIIPVIVILMGILDFIRAVASDKEDGMKKAQSRFVKRLIAAALIFVVPFILEFILEKFGFSVEDCGLELFK